MVIGEHDSTDDDLKKLTNDEAQTLYEPLFSTYFLADMLLDVPAKNALVDHLIKVANDSKTFPSPEPVEMAYSRTMTKSPMRRALVDIMAAKTDVES